MERSDEIEEEIVEVMRRRWVFGQDTCAAVPPGWSLVLVDPRPTLSLQEHSQWALRASLLHFIELFPLEIVLPLALWMGKGRCAPIWP